MLLILLVLPYFTVYACAQGSPMQPACNGTGEVYKRCGTACEPTCDNLNPICTKECVPGCQCQPGFVRDSNKECIISGRCPNALQQPCPGANEERQECARTCQPTCQNPHPRICPMSCILNGCVCKPGYLRNGNACVLPSQCPQ